MASVLVQTAGNLAIIVNPDGEDLPPWVAPYEGENLPILSSPLLSSSTPGGSLEEEARWNRRGSTNI